MSFRGPISDARQVIEDVNKIDGVMASTPFVYSQAMLRSATGVSGAILRGVDPETAGSVIKNLDKVASQIKTAPMQDEDLSHQVRGIILGKGLARNLAVVEDDIVYLISPRSIASSLGYVPARIRFNVIGIFESGMYEYDESLAFIHLAKAQKMLHMGETVTGIAIRVKDIYKAGDTAKEINAALGFPYWTRDWMQMNQNLFAALKLQKSVMFIILALIVLVAAFNIASALIMMVMEKTRDIAILKAMGATNKSIRKIFVFKGTIIGLIGTTIGVCCGFLLCMILKHYNFIELPEGVYYFTTLPVRLESFEVFLIAFATMLICFLATLYPAIQASRLNPIDAIRYG
jgi:lipoprotein-releasing system permease protein